MKTLGNIFWFLLTGWETALAWFFTGLLWCVTIVGIPFGLQCFKLAQLSLFPFGTQVKSNFGSHPIANVIWLLLFGWELALGYVFLGLFWCVTVVGIPFGLQCFKFAQLSLFPFGAEV